MSFDADAQGMAARALANAKIGLARLVMFGDSRAANAWSGASGVVKSSALDWFTWGQSLVSGGPRFRVVANTGVAGNTTTQMAARFTTDVLAYSPDAMTIWGGTNDTWSTTADVDATYARMAAMMDLARGAGVYVFLCSETVCNTKGTGHPPLVFYYNDLLRQYAFANRGVTFLDFNSQVIDPTSANGYPLSTTVYDGLHLSIYGAYLCGKNAVAPALAALPPRGVSLVNSIRDNRGDNTASRNVLDVGLFQGTGGTKGTGHTGTLATGWTTSGTSTVALTTPARADGCGNNQVAAITAAAASDTFLMSATLAQARFVTGASYVLEAEMTLASTSKLTRADIDFVVFAPGSNTGGVLTNVIGSIGEFPADVSAMTLRSPEFVCPSGSLTGATMTLRTAFSAAGSATVTLGRVSLRRVA